MTDHSPARKKLRLSIPVKVVLLTGVTYIVLWGAGFILESTGAVNFSAKFFGMEFRTVFFAFEVFAVALAATLGAHAFLDRPLTRLVNAMSRAEDGDFLVRAPALANDELGELAGIFNRVLSKITDLAADKIETNQDVLFANEQTKFRKKLEEKNAIIEHTNRTLEQLVRDLSLIYEIGQEVNSIIDLDNLYANITETLKKYLRIHEFAILVFDDKQEELIVKASYGFQDEEAVMRTTFRKSEGITGLVAQTGKRIYIKDTSREKRFLNYKSERPVDGSSFLSLPLMFKGEVLGVINFARRGVGSFSYQDVKMLTQVAGQVGLAIANARLYTRTRELSVRDELTGLFNRRYFQQMLQIEWKRAVRFRRTLSVIMIDVDHFKQYNDVHGHLQGDEALKHVGGILKRNLREVDTVARFGGEEFVLLLPDTDKLGSIAVAEKVRMLVERHVFATSEGQKTRPVTISAGIATYPEDVSELDDLIDRADIALYRAKENGRNRTECFTPPKDVSKDTEETEVLAEKAPPKTPEARKSKTLQ